MMAAVWEALLVVFRRVQALCKRMDSIYPILFRTQYRRGVLHLDCMHNLLIDDSWQHCSRHIPVCVECRVFHDTIYVCLFCWNVIWGSLLDPSHSVRLDVLPHRFSIDSLSLPQRSKQKNTHSIRAGELDPRLFLLEHFHVSVDLLNELRR